MSLMRRTPLKRGKQLARTGGLKRGGALPRKRAKPRRSSRKIDKAHLAFVRTLPCCAPVVWCGVQSVAHHATYGRGKGQKTGDDHAMPLCRAHHVERHRLRGAFRGWTQERVREWEAEQVAKVLAARAAEEAA